MNSGAYRPWLIERGSLTKRLQSKTQAFQVRALAVHHNLPYLDEARLLGLPAYQRSLLREVVLMDAQQPLVFAHSVLPDNSLRGVWLGLSRLGNRPLGAALFADPRVTRTPLQYKKLNKHHALYRQAQKHLQQMPNALWARRSIFQLSSMNRQQAIMVTEIFLPAVLNLK
ncbi:MAG: chorismate--pyruvate lyase family protein [Candidatus Methylopumilus sp.]